MRNSPELEQLRRDKMIAKATADLIRMHDGMNSSVEEVRRMVSQYLAEAQRIQRLPKGDKGERGERGFLGPEGRPGKDGKDGKDGFAPVKGKDYLTKGDEDLLVLRVLSRIKTPKDGETPIVDYDKIIEEAVEKLKADKKLDWRDIGGLENELSSYRNQLARKQAGQHGGGDTVVAGTNVTITALPNGTKEISATGGTSPLTTKGDLYGFSTVDARIPVGANGTVLTADSGETLGVKWAAVSGTGDVVGPASSTDNAIARYDLTTGKIIQNSGITLSDTNILGTASGALGITPAAGSNLNVSLSGAGDFAVNTNQLYVDTSTGNVGIGITAPLYKVDVNGGSTASQFHISSGGADSGLYLTTALASQAYMSGGASFSGGAWVAKATEATLFGAFNGNTRIYGNTGLSIGASYTPTERFTIMGNTGNVGIGTTTPNNKLHISESGATDIRLQITNLTTGFGATDGLHLAVDSVGDAYVIQREAANLKLYTNNTPTNGITINSSGNVGIGTTSPSALLTLGTAGTKAGTLSLAGGTSGVITLQTAAAAGTYTLTLPTTDGNSGEVLTTDGSGVLSWVAAGGSGTVTSVSVVTANGISGSVATSTTTPAITLTLGAITPTSVNGITLSGSGSLANSGTSSLTGFTGSGTSSGTNTGDQTTITGNAGTATALQTARTIGTITGDATSAGSSFDGTANNTNALTLATVNANVGSFTYGSFTVNAKGLITAASSGTTPYVPGGTDVAVADGGTGVSSLTAYAPIFGGTTSTGAVQSGTVGSAGQVLTSNGAGALPTFQAPAASGITWTEVTGTSQTAAINNGYITNNAGLVTVTIPTTAPVGSIVRIAGKGAGGWKLAQNASEIIHFDGIDTTTGTGGSLASTVRYDAVEIVCIVADTEWVVISSIGNLTIV